MAEGFQQRELSGSIFKNQRKDQPNQPDYRGDCLINGVPMWVSGWIKETRAGDKFLSLAFSPKDGGFGGQKPVATPSFDDMNGDLPF